MSFKRYIILIFLLLIPFSLISCEKVEEKPLPVVKKTEKPLPPLSQERLSLWTQVAGDIGAYIRKVSLKEEEVYEKRTLVMIAHSSARTQLEYSSIFDKRGMSAKEFWRIVDEMERAQKYFDIKKEEHDQAKELDSLINSGVDEIKVLQRELKKEKSEKKKKIIEDTIKTMEIKIDEFRGFKANLSPDAVKVDPNLLKLWNENKESFETAYRSMWKRNSTSGVRKSYQHM